MANKNISNSLAYKLSEKLLYCLIERQLLSLARGWIDEYRIEFSFDRLTFLRCD